MGILVGYMRVSKTDGSQVLDLQKDALLAAGVEARYLYQDQASGTRDDRPGLANCLKALREGDTLIVWKLDRLGRDLRHLVNTVHDLTAGGIGFKVLTGHGAASPSPCGIRPGSGANRASPERSRSLRSPMACALSVSPMRSWC